MIFRTYIRAIETSKININLGPETYLTILMGARAFKVMRTVLAKF